VHSLDDEVRELFDEPASEASERTMRKRRGREG
jgi:hypothetical protein